MPERTNLTFDLSHVDSLPGLLVSVRNAEEAVTAADSGADVVDVKEPGKGSLGSASPETIRSVVQSVACRVPVTAALGELVELMQAGAWPTKLSTLFAWEGISLYKMGLAGCGGVRNWRRNWSEVVMRISAMQQEPSSTPRPVAVAYADWRRAKAPEPTEVLDAGAALGCPALLIDTWDKSGGMLFDHWPVDSLSTFLQVVHRHNIRVVLAGSLNGENIVRAAALRPALIAVRGAACSAGRNSTVCPERVRELKRSVEEFSIAAVDH